MSEPSTVESPAILFEYARRKSQESAVDRAGVDAILPAAASLPADAVVGINVHPRADLSAVRQLGVDLIQGHLSATAAPGEETREVRTDART